MQYLISKTEYQKLTRKDDLQDLKIAVARFTSGLVYDLCLIRDNHANWCDHCCLRDAKIQGESVCHFEKKFSPKRHPGQTVKDRIWAKNLQSQTMPFEESQNET